MALGHGVCGGLALQTALLMVLIVLCRIQHIATLKDAEIVRLPTTVIPTSYVLDVNTYFLENNFTFDGKVLIDLKVVKATNEIVLHSKGLQILKTYLRVVDPDSSDAKVVFVDDEPINSTEKIPEESEEVGTEQEDLSTAMPERPMKERPIENTNSGQSNTNKPNGNISNVWLFLYEKLNNGSEGADLDDDTESDAEAAAGANAGDGGASAGDRGASAGDGGANAGDGGASAGDRGASAGDRGAGYEYSQDAEEEEYVSSSRRTKRSSELMRGKEQKTKPISIEKVGVDNEKDFLVIKLSSKMVPSVMYRLYIKYSGQLSSDLTGYYKISYKDRNDNRTWWASSTVFEPAEARRAFPCFDEPSFKATFQINLGRPKTMVSLSNTNLLKTNPVSEQKNREVDVYATTPPMSTYLVAFYVGNLEPRESPVATEKPFRMWTRPSVSYYQASYALENGPKILNYLESYLGVKNIWNKTDILALPSFISDALENWGLISFHEKYILHPESACLSQKTRVAAVLGHELAHSWFGNMVTLKWWPAIWLNEGFATYFGILAVDYLHPTWEIRSTQALQVALKILSVDARGSSHALIAAANTKRDLSSLFDVITYYKGYYILRMIHNTIGEKSFRQGVGQYLRQHIYGNVAEEDPWQVLGEQSKKDGTFPPDMDLKEVMRTWTNSPGYPVVSVIRDYSSGTADLIQTRFLFDKDDMESRDNDDTNETSWWIPLTYTSQQDLNFKSTIPKIWLDPNTLVTSMNISDVPPSYNWILFNINSIGMYRVNYDEPNWEMLSKHLQSNSYWEIPPLNRAQLLDDSMDLARSGDLSYSIALSLVTYLSREKHYLPWMAALSNFEYLQNRLHATNSSEKFKTCVRRLITPLFTGLGFTEKANDTPLDVLNREQAITWACATGLKSCVTQAVALFKQWRSMERVAGYDNPIPSNVRKAVYCTAVEHGGEEDWLFLWSQYLETTLRSERSVILAALGCTRRKAILERYLEMSIEGGVGVRKQDALTVFNAVATNRLGLNISTHFLVENIKPLQRIVGDRRLNQSGLLEILASRMNMPAHLNEMTEFETETATKSIFVGKSMQIAKEKLKFNINWVKNNYDSVSEWLNTHKC